MAAKSISKAVSDAILIDWRIGRLSQRDIAEKNKVSAGLVNKICKGVEQDVASIVNAKVQVDQALAVHDERMVNAVHETVDEILRVQKFFRGANMLVANTVTAKVKREGQNASFKDLASAAQALGRTQESVLGKSPDTIINNTNAVQINVAVTQTPDQVRAIKEMLESHC